MSEENVRVVRRSWEALVAGGVDGLAQFWDPQVNWRAIEGAPDDVGEMQGVDTARRYVQEWVDMFDDLTNTVVEARAVDDDRVVTLQHLTGRAKLSGAETELRYAVVYTVRDGKITRWREYATLDEALAAAGGP